eukprot:TRINITY_DN4218_c1_g1_i5.p1 TRINITY_DN4218_c1_g1~~TRINITY_DN4218_c1_g1_i5.p1  ORF type:complete len:4438 (+),score=1224.04 TRINITY_DN4218_c1_g1_i5:2312-15625(+)
MDLKNLLGDSPEMNSVLFFAEKNSALFMHEMGQVTAQHGAVTLRDLPELVQFAEATLRRLVEFDSLQLSDLTAVRQIMERFRNTLHEEMSALIEHFPQAKMHCDNEAVLHAAEELLALRVDLPSICKCHDEGLELCLPAEIDTVRTLCKIISADMSLVKTPLMLEKIRAYTANLTSDQLRIFTVVLRCSDVLRFLQSVPDLDKKINMLNGQLQGYKFATELFNALLGARELLSPFLEALEAADTQRLSLAALCKHIGERVKDMQAAELHTEFDRVDYVHKHLCDVQVWFSSIDVRGLSLEVFMPLVSKFIANGVYISALPPNAKGAHLSLLMRDEDNKEARSSSYVNELICAMKVFISHEDVSEEKNRELREFVELNNVAQLIHATNCKLQALGHEDFQGKTLELNATHERLNVASFGKQLNKLEETLRGWKAKIKEAYTNQPRLWFLDFHQLLWFTKTMGEMLDHPPADGATVLNSLYPFLWACFPEYTDLDPALVRMRNEHGPVSGLTPEVALAAFQKACNNDHHDLLQTSICFVTAVDAAVQPLFAVPYDVAPPAASLRVAAAKRFRGSDLFFLLLSLFEHRLPHPSQVLHCAPCTSAEAVHHFLQRVTHFPALRYAIIGVDALSVEAREALLHWVADMMSEKELAHLTLVFVESTGEEVFQFLHEDIYDAGLVEAEERTALANASQLQPKYLREKRGIGALEVFTGVSSSGKSFDIRQRMNAASTHIEFGVAEDFGTADFIAKYRSVILTEQAPHTALHFNVSAYAPLDMFGRFLELFLLWGVVWDPASGEMLFVPPARTTWYIYVELSCAPPGDQQCTLTSVADALAHVPSLTYMASATVTDSRMPFAIDHAAAFCARTLKCHSDGNSKSFDAFVKSVSCTPLPINEATAVLQPFLEERSEHRATQKRITKLLYCRCMWLWEYARYLQGLQQEGNDIGRCTTPDTIMNIFLDETMQMANTPLRISPIYSLCSRTNPPSLRLINFSDKPTKHHVNVLTVEEAINNTTELRRELGQAFSDRPLWPIIAKLCYVLTPDFMLKLLLLNDCLHARQNVVLTGDTGVGKTELLRMFSLAINLRTDFIPDVLALVSEHLRRDLAKYDIPLVVPTEEVARQADMGKKENERVLSLKGLKAIIEALSNQDVAAPAPIPTSAAAAAAPAVAVPQKLFYVLRASLAQFTHDLLRDYPLLIPTTLVSQVAQAVSEKAEIPVRDVRELSQLLEDLHSGRLKKLFHKILMHQHITAVQFRTKVHSICSSAEKLLAEAPNVSVVVFVDECTSTQVMALLKEVFTDHSLDGQPLPDNIFWVAALNMNDNLAVDASQRSFAVRPPPASLQPLMLDFGSLSDMQQKQFLQSLLQLRYEMGHEVGSPKEWQTLSKAILFAHNFVKRADVVADTNRVLYEQHFVKSASSNRIRASIRDMIRAVDLYIYFRTHPEFVPADEFESEEDEKYTNLHHCAIILAVAVSYYFRLPGGNGGDDNSPRAMFASTFPLDKLGIPKRKTVLEIVQKATDQLFRNTSIPEGIARTDALLQNLFFTVVCVDAKIPLLIVGPPGCSKTLSFRIAMDNMKGKQSHEHLYRSLCGAQPFRYQCSQQSNDNEIKDVYDNAISRQKMFDGAKLQRQRQRAVVLLDEAGLPPEETAPLKVLHYKLDHPKVASVILSNCVLDAAKTNRAVLLLQSAPSPSDLNELAAGCIFNGAVEPGNERRARALRALCAAYEKANALAPVPGLFHLRDFIYFLRYIGRENRGSACGVSPDVVVRSLQRNFGGLDEASFKKLARSFFAELDKQLRTFGDHQWQPDNADTYIKSTLHVLRESINEKIQDESDPNTAPFRYILLLDPSDNEVAISLLFELGLCKQEETDVCRVADFSDDATDLARSEVVLRVKNDMANGRTVVLVDALPISTSFYDVLNKHFDVLRVLPPTEGAAQDCRPAFKYFANVAVGAISRPCFVHPDFRVIVHLPLTALASTPRPFLNRFEKYTLSVDSALDQFSAAYLSPEQRAQLRKLRRGCEDMIARVHDAHNGAVLFGFLPRETLSSLLLTVATKTREANSAALVIPPAFHVVDEQYDAATDEAEKDTIRRLNFHLLQLARPEAVFTADILPVPYLQEYLLWQEHFSVVRLVSKIVEATQHTGGYGNKWCVFTRTCGELSRLHSDASLRSTIFGMQAEHNDNDQWVSVISLHAVPSSRACESELNAFAKSQKRLLLCTVDLASCTTGQINFVRSTVDTLNTRPNQTVVLLMHFPPEMLLLRSIAGGHAVFINGWNFAYVDSLGFTIDSEIADPAPTPDVDARTWLAHAFGVNVNIKQESVHAAFHTLFLQHLRWCCTRMANMPMPHKRAYFVHSSLFYVGRPPGRHTPQDLINYLEKLLHEPLNLAESILGRFQKMWGHSLLYDVVRDACRMIQQGKVTTNMLHVVRSSLSHLLGPLVEHLVRLLCSNFALEAVAAIAAPDRDPDEIQQELSLVRLVLHSIEVPRVAELLARSRANAVAPLAISREFDFPSHLPLFDVVASRVQQLVVQAKAALQRSGRQPTREAMADALQNALESDPVRRALDLITNRNHTNDVGHLLPLYKRDFVTRTLRLYSVYTPRWPADGCVWLDLCVKLVERLTDNNDNSIAHLHLVPEFCQREVSTFPTYIAPLQLLEPPPKLEDLAKLLDNLQQVEHSALLLAVRLLWEKLAALRGAPNPSEAQLENFAVTFRTLRARLDSAARVEAGRCGALDLFKLDVEHVVFLYMLDVCPQVAKAVTAVAASVPELAEIPHSSLQDLLAIAANLVKATPANCEHSEEAAATYVYDLMRYVLSYTAAENEPVFPWHLKRDIFFLLNVIVNKDVPPEVAGICALIAPLQILLFLSSWLVSKPPYWFEKVRSQLAAMVDDGKPVKPFDFTSASLSGLRNPEVFLFHLCTSQEEHALQDGDGEGGGQRAEFLAEEFLHPAEPAGPERYISQAARARLLLSCVAELLRCESPIAEATANLGACFVQCLRQIAVEPHYGNALQFFLNCFGDDGRVIELLQCKQALDHIGMGALFVEVTQAAAAVTTSLLPCMVDPNDPLHDTFCLLREHVGTDNLVNHIQVSLQQPVTPEAKQHMRGALRMCLVLVLYFHFFCKNAACPSVSQQLHQQLAPLLSLSDNECHAYEFLAKGPRNGDAALEQLDPLQYWFSSAALTSKRSLAFPRFMVNLLAVALGSPPDATHLYNCIFDLKALNNTCMPGSSFTSRNMWDCGFRYDAKLDPADPAVMGNCTRYRVALNATVWAAVSWSLLLLPESSHQAAVTNNHFLNYLAQEKGGDDQQKVRNYVCDRATTFFLLLASDSEVASQHVDPVHFLNEFLYYLWRCADNGGNTGARPEALRGLFKTADALAYEGVMKSLFDDISAHYEELKAVYYAAAFKQCPAISEVNSRRAQATKCLASPFVSWAFFSDWLSHLPEQQQAECQLLFKFNSMHDFLRGLEALPLFVELYLEFSSSFSFHFTAEEVQKVSVLRAIDAFRDCPAVHSRLAHLWESFRSVLPRVQAIIELGECQAAENRFFADSLKNVCDDTRLADFVSLDDVMLPDLLFRSVVSMFTIQTKLLACREDNYSTEEWNPGGLVCEQEAEQLSLRSLPRDSHYLLVTGINEEDFHPFVLSQMRVAGDACLRAKVSFDLRRVVREVLERYTCGRCNFYEPKSDFRQPLRFLTEELAGVPPAANKEPGEEVVQLLHLSQHDERSLQLHLSACNVEQFGEALAPAKLEARLGRMNEEALREAASLLCSLMDFVLLAQDASREGDATAAAAVPFTALPTETVLSVCHKCYVDIPDCLRSLHTLQLAFLRSVAAAVYHKLHVRDFLFSNVESHYKKALDEKLQQNLSAVAESILLLSKDDKAHWADLIEEVATALKDKKKLQPNRLLRNLYKSTDVTTTNADDAAILCQLLPDSVTSSVYCDYMRWLFGLLGDVRASLEEPRPADAKRRAPGTLALRERDEATLYHEVIVDDEEEASQTPAQPPPDLSSVQTQSAPPASAAVDSNGWVAFNELSPLLYSVGAGALWFAGQQPEGDMSEVAVAIPTDLAATATVAAAPIPAALVFAMATATTTAVAAPTATPVLALVTTPVTAAAAATAVPLPVDASVVQALTRSEVVPTSPAPVPTLARSEMSTSAHKKVVKIVLVTGETRTTMLPRQLHRKLSELHNVFFAKESTHCACEEAAMLAEGGEFVVVPNDQAVHVFIDTEEVTARKDKATVGDVLRHLGKGEAEFASRLRCAGQPLAMGQATLIASLITADSGVVSLATQPAVVEVEVDGKRATVAATTTLAQLERGGQRLVLESGLAPPTPMSVGEVAAVLALAASPLRAHSVAAEEVVPLVLYDTAGAQLLALGAHKACATAAVAHFAAQALHRPTLGEVRLFLEVFTLQTPATEQISIDGTVGEGSECAADLGCEQSTLELVLLGATSL